MIGIYLITHTTTGRKYVGQSVNIARRLKRHSKDDYDTHLSRAIRKHGWAAFTTQVLEECLPEQLDELERKWVEKLNCISPRGFNLTNGGGHGHIVLDDTKRKHSLAGIGKIISPAHRRKISLARKGMVFSAETRMKMSESAKARPRRTHEQCQAVSRKLQGRIKSKTERRNISKAKKGMIFTEQHRANLSAAQKRRWGKSGDTA